MNRREENNIRYLKTCAFGLLLLAVFVLQTSFGIRIMLFGVKLNLLPYVVAAAALYDGPGAAAVIGFLAGVLCDAFHAGADGLFPLYYMLFGMGAGLIYRHYFRKVFLALLLFGAGGLFLLNLLQYTFFYSMLYGIPILRFLYAATADTFLSAMFSPLVYLAARKIDEKFSIYE